VNPLCLLYFLRDAAESDAARCIDCLGMTGGGAVTPAESREIERQAPRTLFRVFLAFIALIRWPAQMSDKAISQPKAANANERA
jgi:hypothetical protein